MSTDRLSTDSLSVTDFDRVWKNLELVYLSSRAGKWRSLIGQSRRRGIEFAMSLRLTSSDKLVDYRKCRKLSLRVYK